MRRRALLTALTAGTAGLAGCSFRWGPDDGGGAPATEPPEVTPPPTDTPDATVDDPVDGVVGEPAPPPGVTTTYVGDGRRRLAVGPRELRVADRVRLALGFGPTAGETPTELLAIVENVRDHEVVVETGRLPLVGRSFARQVGTDGPATIVFAPTEDNELAEFAPDVERGPEGYWRLTDADREGSPYPERFRLSPGTRVAAHCAVVGSPGDSGWPTGTYRNRTRGGELTLHVWHGERPGPTDASRFGDRSVPAPFDGEPGVVWYHQAGPETTAYLVPERERVELPGAATFTAVNHTGETLGCGFWRLFKLVDGAFYDLSPPARTGACRQLSPGERESYRVVAFSGEPVAGDGDPRERHVGHLGGGVYAALSGYGTDGRTTGALVELDGPPVEIRPSDDVTAERDGATVTVRDARRGDAEAEPATATLTRVDADAARTLIPEQVGQPWNRALRNTLPFLGDGVDRVVLRTSVAVLATAVEFGLDDYRFNYRGQGHRLAVERDA
jgi:hypothetical protein